MAIQFPDISEKLGLGLGLDMPWGDAFGFDPKVEAPTERVLKFLRKYGEDFNYGFLSCHPKSRGELNPKDYQKAFARFFDSAADFKARALHHTFLNLGAVEAYEKDSICESLIGLNRENNNPV